jgi:hypothetical protein
MSFRLFIYYCALCGGCAAYVGWALGRLPAIQNSVTLAAVRGLLVGLTLSLALGLIDALASVSSFRLGTIGLRVLVATVSGCIAGFIGGFVGQIFYKWLQLSLFLVVGWTLAGLLIGGSLGVFEVLDRLMRDEDVGGAQRKSLHGMLGGAVGGLLGGCLYLLFAALWGGLFRAEGLAEPWSPGATGFAALGLCIGLLIGLARVILKEAWLRVEAGFRPGRELILSKPATTIGRGEGCDIGLFGDPGVERMHARILRRNGRYLLADEDTPGGTFINGRRIDGPTPLRSGDKIRLGRSLLHFGEREKRGGE